jgi:hypothetical protein
VAGLLGLIPPEWKDNCQWKRKLERPVRQEVLDMFDQVERDEYNNVTRKGFNAICASRFLLL